MDTGSAAHMVGMSTRENAIAAREQYAAAKECLTHELESREWSPDLKDSMRDLAEAQVHATLALAAATMALGPHQ